jgi:CRP/FNR family transcriptional regulator, anaerobic regulatory protein
MSHSNGFVLHRPELTGSLERGDEKLRNLMKPVTRVFAAGETVVEQEADHPYVYRLRTGWAGRVRSLPDGRRQYILLFLPDDLFAIKGLFMTSHGDAIEALSDVTVELVHYRELYDLYVRDPDVALRCNWQVVEEERRLHNWIVSLGQGAADERLAQVLLEWHGRLIRAGQIDEEASEYRLPMTQEEVGDHLGLTAVHVNRVLRKFREERLALIKGGMVQLLDPVALRRIASPIQDEFERSESSQPIRDHDPEA